jgi:ABC-type branched-subunit amino acid transport system ATPase component
MAIPVSSTHTSPEMPATRAEAPLLSIQSLTAGYRGTPVIFGIDLAVAPGQIVCVAGSNGAGKSTLLKTLIRELPVMEGRIVLAGEDVSKLTSEAIARKGVAYVPQVENVFETLTVRENLEMGGYLLGGRELGERTTAMFEMFPMLSRMSKQVVRTLSGGERKLVSLARALMPAPSLLVVDEPTAGLSPVATEAVLNSYLPELARSGASILLVEQKVNEAFAASDYGYVLVHGSVGLHGPCSDLLARGDLGQIFMAAAPAGNPMTYRRRA